MESVEAELPVLINLLLQAPADAQRRLIEKYFLPECRLTHALVIADNRDEIIKVFQFWRFFNAKLSANVREIIMDQHGDKCWALLTQKVENFGHIPFLSFELTMSTLLYLVEDEAGKKRIQKQLVGSVWPITENLLRSIPMVDRHWHEVKRCAARLWWHKEEHFHGRQAAPYNPAM